MNALIITHIQMYDVIKPRLKKKKKKKLKDVLIYVKKSVLYGADVNILL